MGFIVRTEYNIFKKKHRFLKSYTQSRNTSAGSVLKYSQVFHTNKLLLSSIYFKYLSRYVIFSCYSILHRTLHSLT